MGAGGLKEHTNTQKHRTQKGRPAEFIVIYFALPRRAAFLFHYRSSLPLLIR